MGSMSISIFVKDIDLEKAKTLLQDVKLATENIFEKQKLINAHYNEALL